MNEDRDDELATALRRLPTPDHGPDFWADLEERLADELPLPSVTRLHTRRFRPRGMWLVSAAAVAVMVVAAVAVLRPSGTTRLRVAPPVAPPDTARWTTLPDSSLSLRQGHTAVWTGETMLLWGGTGPDGRPLADGAAYDPSTDRWQPMAESPTGPLDPATAVWTGRRMLVWGMRAGTPDDPGSQEATGAAYDPADDTWVPISRSTLTGVAGQTAVWTGDRMLVWGGSTGESPVGAGAAYDPSTDRWTPLAAAPIGPRFDHSAVWTGDHMIVWGGTAGEGSSGELADGASYDPSSDSWTKLPPAPIAGRALHSAVWTGSAMIVWGGTSSPSGPVADGAGYDPATGSWQLLPTAPLGPRLSPTAVTGDGWMLLWGGSGPAGEAMDDGAAYDPGARTWRRLPDGPLQPRSRHTAVWTGSAMVVAGGADLQALRSDAGALRPVLR